MSNIKNESQLIQGITFPDGSSVWLDKNITCIEPYTEESSNGLMTWLMIFKYGRLYERVNVAYVQTIRYVFDN